ncbi:MAG: phosphatidate cytidylyltransferase, partial [Lachnospiraceae bacterium]|nr:phosphatidate cytidylyltransferase [Lachnospiraceae bacterium]
MLAMEYLKGLLFLHLHFMLLAGIVILVNKRFGLPSEIYRKLLHIVAVFSIMPIVVPSNSWLASVLVCGTFLLESYLGGRFSPLLKKVDVKERKAGEQQSSMFLLFGTYIFLILNCWAALGQKWMVILSVVAWGVGDAAAALVGKRFGRHKVSGRLIEGTKSLEGSAAMFVMS